MSHISLRRTAARSRPAEPSRRTVFTGLFALTAATLTACGSVQEDSGGSAGLGAAQGSSSQYFAPAERTVVPTVQGTTLEGAEADIASLRGDVVVINIWGSWCAPCRKEAPELKELAEQTEPLGVTFLGINVRDNRTAAKGFERTYGITYPSIYDPSGRTMAGFQSLAPRAVPTTYVLDREGRVAAVSIGPLTYRDFLPIIEDIAAETA
ncbi:TlpA disulfide reductase family protein [Streptomyces sp. YIM 98790]|uniref:TlpA family protein disulfide reductase n=1 Tax=Streptomyces sp. YIM 98790 TaxID=2689077 RepID=UPI0014089A32|nr:TlpA disulfide reductase family protein [Streptomyces sp. YIM 98790]